MEEPKYDPSRPMPTLKIAFQYELTNAPGKSNVGLLVEFPPGAMSPPHRHAGASASAYVIKGSLQNKMNDDPMQVFNAGGTWHERPGCHHKISNNASETEPATLFVSMIQDTEALKRDGMDAIIVIDEEYRDVVKG